MDIARRCAFKLLTVKERRSGEFRLLLTSVGDFAVQLSNWRSVVWKESLWNRCAASPGW